MVEDGGPAFPHPGSSNPPIPAHGGMSLRDWFAGQALAGMAASGRTLDPRTRGDTATLAYRLADALLRVREAGKDGSVGR